MKSSIKLISILILIVLASPVILLKGCGNETAAPNGSTITVSPPLKSWASVYTTLGCPSSTLTNMELFQIVVLDSNKKPLNGVTITVTLDLSPGTGGAGIQILRLFDESGNLVSSPYTVQTGDFGTTRVWVQVDPGCEYSSILGVYSGTAFGFAQLDVVKK